MKRNTISLDLQIRILDACDRHEGTQRQIAECFKVFFAFVKKHLGQRKRLGLIDNLSFRVGRGGVSAPLFAGPESPRKKVEQIQDLLRTIASRASSALHRAIRKALRLVTSQDADSWFSSCGYIIP